MNEYDRFWQQAMGSARRNPLRSPSADLDPDYVRRATLAYPSIVKQERPILLNEGTPWEEPFGAYLAWRWAERLAREVLGS